MQCFLQDEEITHIMRLKPVLFAVIIVFTLLLQVVVPQESENGLESESSHTGLSPLLSQTQNIRKDVVIDDRDDDGDVQLRRRKKHISGRRQRTRLTKEDPSRRRLRRITKAIKSYLRKKRISLSDLDDSTLHKLRRLYSAKAEKQRRKKKKSSDRERERLQTETKSLRDKYDANNLLPPKIPFETSPLNERQKSARKLPLKAIVVEELRGHGDERDEESPRTLVKTVPTERELEEIFKPRKRPQKLKALVVEKYAEDKNPQGLTDQLRKKNKMAHKEYPQHERKPSKDKAVETETVPIDRSMDTESIRQGSHPATSHQGHAFKKTHDKIQNTVDSSYPSRRVLPEEQKFNEDQLKALAAVVDHYSQELSDQEDLLSQIIEDTKHTEEVLNRQRELPPKATKNAGKHGAVAGIQHSPTTTKTAKDGKDHEQEQTARGKDGRRMYETVNSHPNLQVSDRTKGDSNVKEQKQEETEAHRMSSEEVRRSGLPDDANPMESKNPEPNKLSTADQSSISKPSQNVPATDRIDANSVEDLKNTMSISGKTSMERSDAAKQNLPTTDLQSKADRINTDTGNYSPHRVKTPDAIRKEEQALEEVELNTKYSMADSERKVFADATRTENKELHSETKPGKDTQPAKNITVYTQGTGMIVHTRVKGQQHKVPPDQGMLNNKEVSKDFPPDNKEADVKAKASKSVLDTEESTLGTISTKKETEPTRDAERSRKIIDMAEDKQTAERSETFTVVDLNLQQDPSNTVVNVASSGQDIRDSPVSDTEMADHDAKPRKNEQRKDPTVNFKEEVLRQKGLTRDSTQAGNVQVPRKHVAGSDRENRNTDDVTQKERDDETERAVVFVKNHRQNESNPEKESLKVLLLQKSAASKSTQAKEKTSQSKLSPQEIEHRIAELIQQSKENGQISVLKPTPQMNDRFNSGVMPSNRQDNRVPHSKQDFQSSEYTDTRKQQSQLAQQTEDRVQLTDMTEERMQQIYKTDDHMQMTDKSEDKMQLTDQSEDRIHITDQSEDRMQLNDETEDNDVKSHPSSNENQVNDKEIHSKFRQLTNAETAMENDLQQELSAGAGTKPNFSDPPMQQSEDFLHPESFAFPKNEKSVVSSAREIVVPDTVRSDKIKQVLPEKGQIDTDFRNVEVSPNDQTPSRLSLQQNSLLAVHDEAEGETPHHKFIGQSQRDFHPSKIVDQDENILPVDNYKLSSLSRPGTEGNLPGKESKHNLHRQFKDRLANVAENEAIEEKESLEENESPGKQSPFKHQSPEEYDTSGKQSPFKHQSPEENDSPGKQSLYKHQSPEDNESPGKQSQYKHQSPEDNESPGKHSPYKHQSPEENESPRMQSPNKHQSPKENESPNRYRALEAEKVFRNGAREATETSRDALRPKVISQLLLHNPTLREKLIDVHGQREAIQTHAHSHDRVSSPVHTLSEPKPIKSVLMLGNHGNSSEMIILRQRTDADRSESEFGSTNMTNATSSERLSELGSEFFSEKMLLSAVGFGTIFLVFCFFLCVCGISRCYRHHQYRRAFNRLEESFSGLNTDRPIYLRLGQLRRCKAGNQYVVTIVDDSKFSVVDHDLESEDEIFDVTDIKTADKKGPLSRLQWTNPRHPY